MREFTNLVARWRRSCAAGLVVVAMMPACLTVQAWAEKPSETGRTYSEQEADKLLRSELTDVERYFEVTGKHAYALLQARKISERDLKRFGEQQNHQIARISQAFKARDALTALADAWATSDAFLVALEGGGDTVPGPVHEVALDMARRRHDRLLHVASRYLPAEDVQRLSRGIRSYSTRQADASKALPSGESTGLAAPMFSAWAKGQSALGNVLQLPLAPGRALKGISESGKALSGMRDTAADAILLANEMPERIRIEFQQVLNELLARRSEILEILDAVSAVSTNVNAAVQSGQVVTASAKESIQIVQEIVPHAEAIATSVERTVKSMNALVDAFGARQQASPQGVASNRVFDVREYTSAAAAIGDSAHEIAAAVEGLQALMALSAGVEPRPGARPFDIREYAQAAQSIERSATEIRGVLDALNEVSGNSAFQARIAELRAQADASADHAEHLARQFVDHLVSRLLIALALSLLMLLAYGRLKRRSETASA